MGYSLTVFLPQRGKAMALRPPVRWTEYAHLRFTGRDPYKPRINKARTAELIETLGLNGPKVHGVYARAADIDFAALPNRFVLKPTELSGKRGVMLLKRLNPRRGLAQRLLGRLGLAGPAPEPAYHDAMLDRRLTVAEIVAEQDEWARLFAEKRNKPLEFIVEDEIRSEWSSESRPREYKVYAFAGELALIVQYSREVTPPRVCFFDGEFRPIHDRDGKVIRGPTIRRGKHIKPKCAAGILDDAGRILAGARDALRARRLLRGARRRRAGRADRGHRRTLSRRQLRLLRGVRPGNGPALDRGAGPGRPADAILRRALDHGAPPNLRPAGQAETRGRGRRPGRRRRPGMTSDERAAAGARMDP